MNKAIVDKEFNNLISKSKIYSDDFELSSYVQPASIDLPIGNVAYLIKEKFLPYNKKISDIVENNSIEMINLDKGAVLLKGQTYLIPSINIDFTNTNYYGSISPKSSIGRIDLMVRSIFDNFGLYDTIDLEFKGQIFIEVSPQSFNVKVKKGLALSQMMIFDSSLNSKVNFDFEKLIFDENKNLIKNKLYKNSLILSVAIPNNKILGFEAISTNEIIDLSIINSLNYTDFFREIRINSNKFTLQKDKFYILYIKENIRIPNNLSSEMLPFSHLIGELRAHYAGFFDPGFGSKFGCSAVLEVRPHETITIFDGQPICLMDFFENSSLPDKLYGDNKNNYQNQNGPKLAKYFKY